MPQLITVATDYYEAPAGRYPADGNYNGERFREDFLAPALRSGGVVVNLDGTEGYGSSFLDEVFGGLVRKSGFSEWELKEKLSLISEEDETLISEIWGYIADAEVLRAGRE